MKKSRCDFWAGASYGPGNTVLITVIDFFLSFEFFIVPHKIDCKLWISECNVSRLALIICGLLPVDQYIFRFSIAVSS